MKHVTLQSINVTLNEDQIREAMKLAGISENRPVPVAASDLHGVVRVYTGVIGGFLLLDPMKVKEALINAEQHAAMVCVSVDSWDGNVRLGYVYLGAKGVQSSEPLKGFITRG